MNAERILVVDDEATMLHSMVRLLEGRYVVRGAASGEEALVQAAEQAPDLAILDVRMPGMDGFALANRLRTAYPGVDVILMTGEVLEVDTQVVRAIREGAFYFVQKPFDREVLLTLVERCMELRRLADENGRYVKRLEEELADARNFQRSILPPGELADAKFELSAEYIPCTELGGDFYDYVVLGEDGLAFLVADVSGHGVTAAMLTATLKSAFHGTLSLGFSPDAVVARVAEALRTFDEGRFVTLFAGRVGTSGTLVYVNAGHPAPLLLPANGGAGSVRRLGITGPMVSPAFPDLDWELLHERLEPGDRLWIYTDGVAEARSEEGECFGEERIVQGADAAVVGERTLRDLVAQVRTHAGGRPLEDDLTLVRIGRKPT